MSVDGLRCFFDEHYREVLGAVTLVTGSRAVAEDAVNEAVARAWERREGIEQLNRWVLTVALNIARNRWRRTRR
jgi:RNA polymerase sigma-70 factor, ECF subfamily